MELRFHKEPQIPIERNIQDTRIEETHIKEVKLQIAPYKTSIRQEKSKFVKNLIKKSRKYLIKLDIDGGSSTEGLTRPQSSISIATFTEFQTNKIQRLSVWYVQEKDPLDKEHKNTWKEQK